MDAPRHGPRPIRIAVIAVVLGIATLLLFVVAPGWPQFYAAPIVMFVVSAAYFMASSRDAPLSRRVLTSAHGLVGSILTLGALALYATGNSRPVYGPVFFSLYFIPLGLALASLFSYSGPKRMHSLQGPNVAAMLWGGFIGGMAASGEWL